MESYATDIDEDGSTTELDSSPVSQRSTLLASRTASSSTPSYPLMPIRTIQDHQQNDLARQVMHLLSQNGNNTLVQQAAELLAIQNNAPAAFLPNNYASLPSLVPHRELQYPSWNNTLPSFPQPFINSHLLTSFPETQTVNRQLAIQQLLQSVDNTNMMRQHDGQISSHLQAILLHENLANREAMLSRQAHASTLAAYLLSRSIVNQNIAIPDPPPPPPPQPPPQAQMLPRILAQPEDRFTLSEFQVFLRQNIEVFQASHEEASIHVRGRNAAIYLHQVGIRCIHCKHVSMARRKKGFMYFPSNTQRIYQAAQNMATAHMISGLCGEMPAEIKEQFQILMTRRSISGRAGRVYWAQSAETHLGLVNTPLGIRGTGNATTMI